MNGRTLLIANHEKQFANEQGVAAVKANAEHRAEETRLPVTKEAPSATKDLDNYIWAGAFIAVVLVAFVAALVAA